MTRVAFAVLAAGVLMFEAERASALDEVCDNEVDPGPPGMLDAFGVQCLKGDQEYARVQCSTSTPAGAVSCSYSVSDPGDFCAVSVSCNVYFLNEQGDVLDRIYIEEGATDAQSPGLWTKTRVACGCLEWW